MPAWTAKDGTAIHFTDEGPRDAFPILCLSGLTRNGSDFDYLAAQLPDARLIRIDYRGRGRSGWADPATYTIPAEAGDVLGVLDHLGLERVAIIGTSRGGLISMVLAALARARLAGVCLNDIGPDLAPEGLAAIKGYVGLNPSQKTIAEAAEARSRLMAGFANVSATRWFEEASRHYHESARGLTINYDPRLRDAVLAAETQAKVDLWPLFDAMQGLPLALIRGANSNLLAPETADEMQRRRPDMIRADVPDRGHVPFLDEPEALEVIHKWREQLA